MPASVPKACAAPAADRPFFASRRASSDPLRSVPFDNHPDNHGGVTGRNQTDGRIANPRFDGENRTYRYASDGLQPDF